MQSITALGPTHIAACERILAALPDWFALEAANRAYIESLHSLPGFVATEDGEVMGFLALEIHNPRSAEVHVMAVAPSRHRAGLGRALLLRAEDWAHEQGYAWLHVKTRGPSAPDPHYDRTRRFYLAMGFAPLFETDALWGPEDPALVLVKQLGAREAQARIAPRL